MKLNARGKLLLFHLDLLLKHLRSMGEADCSRNIAVACEVLGEINDKGDLDPEKNSMNGCTIPLNCCANPLVCDCKAAIFAMLSVCNAKQTRDEETRQTLRDALKCLRIEREFLAAKLRYVEGERIKLSTLLGDFVLGEEPIAKRYGSLVKGINRLRDRYADITFNDSYERMSFDDDVAKIVKKELSK